MNFVIGLVIGFYAGVTLFALLAANDEGEK